MMVTYSLTSCLSTSLLVFVDVAGRNDILPTYPACVATGYDVLGWARVVVA